MASYTTWCYLNVLNFLKCSLKNCIKILANLFSEDIYKDLLKYTNLDFARFFALSYLLNINKFYTHPKTQNIYAEPLFKQ